MLELEFPYRSRRLPVMAENVVATSQPLATQAGIQMLRTGGNAVDAILAAAITLTVVEPTSNGIGGDAFTLVWDGEGLHGLNGSGKSPSGWSPERFRGLTEMPRSGWDCVTVPGAVSVWAELSARFGRLDFAKLFEPAIYYATEGYPVSPITSYRWQSSVELYQGFPEFCRTFLPGGAAPQPGELFQCKEMAETLNSIAATRGESFYRGDLASKIAASSRAEGGVLDTDDLSSHRPVWVEPISRDYRDYTLHEIPPNGQGIAALVALGILDAWELQRYPVDSADSIHLQVEAMKLAFADIFAHLADPEHMVIEPAELLDPGYLEQRATKIDMSRAADPPTGLPRERGTVYLCAADSSGMMVSFIQSNYNGFGSGIVVPGTGISLHNRAAGFTLEEGHPNQVGGSKRPFHTIIPAFVTRNGTAEMSFGVMGAHMQAQGHVQMMTRIFDYGQNPQTASDGPRWQVLPGPVLAVEPGFTPEVLQELENRGHRIVTTEEEHIFGGAQLIRRVGRHYAVGSDHRKDGHAAGY